MQFAKRQIFAVKCQFGQTAKLKAIGKKPSIVFFFF